MEQKYTRNSSIRPQAILIGIVLGREARHRAIENLAELVELARAAGAEPVHTFLQEREAIDPAFYLGRGKIEEIHNWISEHGVEMVIFDDELVPSQHRNLEKILRCRVLDRTLLVLDIFAGRAKTGEGKLQVELAQLSYLLPRLSGKGIELSRLGGGIGTRGPGETKLESDRRKIHQRIAVLRKDLDSVRRRRSIHRSARREIPAPSLALVGYTNAGKTTLFNALTESQAPASAQLFATLDPLVRGMHLPDGRLALLSDTVGFIRKLPHQLVAAFRATLEEVTNADLLLHVIDASSDNYLQQVHAVTETLVSLHCHATPLVNVFNKSDLLSPHAHAGLERQWLGFSDSVIISAVSGEGLARLRQIIARVLPDRRVNLIVEIPYAESRLRSAIYETGVVQEEQFLDSAVRIEALVEPWLAEQLSSYRKPAAEELEFAPGIDKRMMTPYTQKQ